ncbi:MAG: hypothetical protein QOG04_1921, partial [Actinomycetota bacterium]|nr:hypothetical protein [Actinomycetota bacterium]
MLIAVAMIHASFVVNPMRWNAPPGPIP